MSEKFTPGPWVTRPTASLGPQYVVYPEADGEDIAIIYDHGNTKSNALLIAASPDLFEACENALRTMRKYGNSNMGFAIGVCKKAIAKAEGEE